MMLSHARCLSIVSVLLLLTACGKQPAPPTPESAPASTSTSSEPITISNAMAMAPPPGSSLIAVYLEVVSAQADVLLGASTPAAGSVEMHETKEHEGMLQMRPVPELALKAGEPVEFAPGGLHFMLLDVREPLVAGTKMPMTLRFKSAGEVTVDVSIVPPGAAGHDEDHEGHEHHEGHDAHAGH